MNYTKNYRLPQWVKEDRVLMEDFNDAMSNIESGLAGIQRGLDGNAADGVQAQSRTWDALLRAGRGLLARRMEQFSRDNLYVRNGLLFNPLSGAEMAETMSGTQWNEHLGVYAGRGEYRPDDVLLSSCTSCQTGSLGTTPTMKASQSFYEFTSPLTGTLKIFNLYLYTHFNSTQNHLDLALTLTVEQLTGSGAGVKATRELRLERDGLRTTEEEVPIQLDLPLVKGNKYRLHLQRHNDPGPIGLYGFMTSRVHSDLPELVPYTKFFVLDPPIRSASHTRSYPTEGRASHAIAVVRYRKGEDASALTVTLGGRTMDATGERTVTGRDGQPCQERWLAAEGGWDGTVSARFSLKSTATDNLQLLEYAILLL